MNRKISLIAAVAENGVIGNNGHLPWHIKKDFAWFVQQTNNKTIVMGRKNYEDIIQYTKGQPLKNRKNIVLTTKNLQVNNFYIEHSIEDVLNKYSEDLMIIGGTEIYQQFLPYAQELIITEIHKKYEGNSFFPHWSREQYIETYRQKEEENNIKFDFVIYKLKD